MSFYPCVAGPHYNPGKGLLWYFAIGSGDDFARKRLRYCSAHASQLHDRLSKFEVRPENMTVSGFDAPIECFVCGEPVGERRCELFITSYPTKDERVDYWARVHGHCSDGYWAYMETLNTP